MASIDFTFDCSHDAPRTTHVYNHMMQEKFETSKTKKIIPLSQLTCYKNTDVKACNLQDKCRWCDGVNVCRHRGIKCPMVKEPKAIVEAEEKAVITRELMTNNVCYSSKPEPSDKSSGIAIRTPELKDNVDIEGSWYGLKCPPLVCSKYLLEWLPNVGTGFQTIIRCRIVKNPDFDQKKCASLGPAYAEFAAKSNQIDRFLLPLPPGHNLHGVIIKGAVTFPAMWNNGNKGKEPEALIPAGKITDIMMEFMYEDSKDKKVPNTVRMMLGNTALINRSTNPKNYDEIAELYYEYKLSSSHRKIPNPNYNRADPNSKKTIGRPLTKNEIDSVLRYVGGNACMQNPNGLPCRYAAGSFFIDEKGEDAHGWITAHIARVEKDI